ncbi:MAG: hypothetical protein STSR0003_22430 [Smithella sp.]
MSSSYRMINYTLRPAKTIERKMLCDVFHRLYPFGKIETYRYIGFGSIYFSDFQLFHRNLGIDSMLSIEKDAYAKECFEFNKPYKCITVDYRKSSEVLPELDLTAKSIIWLDYDSKLDESILSDIDTVCAKACSGSMLIVTLNIHPDRPASEEQKNGYSEQTGKQYNVDDYALHEFRQRLGDAVPNEIKGSDLRAKTIGVITRKILSSKVADALSARNGVLQRDKKMHSRQIIYFLYSDSAPMITIGWIFHEAGDENKYEACAFDELKFVRCEESAYTINAPCLTSKEMRHLNSQLPQGGVVNIPGVPNGDIEKYAELYRYFPAFVEAIYS